FCWTESADRGCSRDWGVGECLLATALAVSRSRWIAARSPLLTIGGSQENFQSKQISSAEMPGRSFQLMLFAIWLQRQGAEKLEMISRTQQSARPKRSQRSTYQSNAEATPQ